jgi:hypothetical protein
MRSTAHRTPRRAIALLMLPVLLAACASVEERAAREQRVVARLQESCVRMGFTPGTLALERCIRQLYAAEVHPDSIGATPAAPGICVPMPIVGARLVCY